jgi:hypothetical protein
MLLSSFAPQSVVDDIDDVASQQSQGEIANVLVPHAPQSAVAG